MNQIPASVDIGLVIALIVTLIVGNILPDVVEWHPSACQATSGLIGVAVGLLMGVTLHLSDKCAATPR